MQTGQARLHLSVWDTFRKLATQSGIGRHQLHGMGCADRGDSQVRAQSVSHRPTHVMKLYHKHLRTYAYRCGDRQMYKQTGICMYKINAHRWIDRQLYMYVRIHTNTYSHVHSHIARLASRWADKQAPMSYGEGSQRPFTSINSVRPQTWTVDCISTPLSSSCWTRLLPPAPLE